MCQELMMNALAFLLAGYNIPFLVALGCCVGLALMQIVAGFGDSDADADHDVDVDANLDAHADHDVDVDHDIHHAEGGALALLGVGKVPLMLVLMAFLGSFGAVGLLANTLVAGAAGAFPGWALPITLVVSAVAALPLTGALSRQLGRVAARSSTAVSNQQLVGRVGLVVSPSVSRSYGRVQVRDAHGSLHTVFAIIDSDTPLPEHSEVALVSYDEGQRRFVVRAL
jgi:membrane protein implicated in regulation of membrane protease activity